MSATETKVNLRPLEDRVVVKVCDETEKTAGGIYIPDSAREKPQKGEVMAVGNGRMLDNGQRKPLDVEVGNIVLFTKYGGSDVKIDSVEYKILSERDILGVVEQ